MFKKFFKSKSVEVSNPEPKKSPKWNALSFAIQNATDWNNLGPVQPQHVERKYVAPKLPSGVHPESHDIMAKIGRAHV